MEELKSILNEIMNVYNEEMNNAKKHKLLSTLWTNYYKLSNNLDVNLDEAYNLYLIGENESYIIEQSPERKEINKAELDKALKHLKEVEEDNLLGLNNGITRAEAKLILDYSLENTRKSFEMLGLNLNKSSLNGLCELGQAISLMPLESIGLKVTENKARDTFNYNLNHHFGTVEIPIFEDGSYEEKTYLIDPTYRQFFSSIRCNEGRYYTTEENTQTAAFPDPGYFVEDESFAKELMKDGYIELTPDNARTYGEAFYKASIPKDKVNTPSNINYLASIKKNTSDYEDIPDLEDFNLLFPTNYNTRVK